MVNPAIAMGVKQLELPDPLAQYGKIAAIQQAQNQNALAQYQLGAAQRTETRETARMNALAQAGTDEAAIANALLRSGDITGYSAFENARAERAAKAKLRQKTEGEILDAALKRSRGLLDTLDPNDPEAANMYIAWHEANHDDPVIGKMLASRGITAEQSRARIMAALQKPGGLAQLINQSKLGVEEFLKQNKPITQVINQGGQSQVIQTPGLGGAPTTIGTYADVPLPAAVEEQQRRLKQAGASTSFTNVQTFTPASETAQAEYMKGVRATYDTLKNAPATLKNIDAAKALIPKAAGFMGPGGEPLLKAASFLSNRFGVAVDVKGITDATELRSRLFSGVIENLRKLDAQPTQLQQQALQEAIGNLGTDPNALPRVLDAMADSIRDKVELYNQDVTSAEQRGVKFPYKPQITLPSPSTGGAATAAPAAANIPIPQAAIDDLKAGRGTDAQFDATFGAGAAKRVRGQK